MGEAEDQSERQKTQKDILWGLYQEYRTHARHNETLRSTVNNMLVVAAVAIISFATYDKSINEKDLPAFALLVGVGFLGLLFSASYTERVLKHKRRAKECLTELDSTVFKEPVGKRQLTEVIEDSDREHKKSSVGKIGKTTNSHLFWLVLPLVIMSAGIALIIFYSGIPDIPVPATHSYPLQNQ